MFFLFQKVKIEKKSGKMGNSDCHDWVRLEVLILRRACTLLRKLFRRRWKLSESTEWKDSPEFGHQFVSGLGSQIYQNCGRLHKLTLEEGDITNWDFNMLSRILQETPFKLPESMKAELEDESKRLEQLISFRNKATQHNKKSMDDDEFCRYWDEIEKVLVSFGESEKELEELKLSPSISEDSLLSSSIMSDDDQRPVSPEHVSEARRLKDEAKSALNSSARNKNKIDHALQSLTKAIALKGLPEMELGVLYASRCEAYLRKATNITDNAEGRKEIAYLALKDAKQALNLRPAWGLAHYRVGKAYVELRKFKKAAKYLDQALDLEPDVDEIKKDRKTCDLRLIEFERLASSSGFGSSRGTTPDAFDDFDPTSKTFPPSLQPTYLPGATRLSPIVQHCMDRIFFDWDDRSNPLAGIYRAHKLRDGVDVKRNYKEAALLYRKGVKSQNAEAMYNLALLKLNGHGVKHDVAGAILLLKKAAKQPYKIFKGSGSNFVSNVGVGEAEFLLGLLNYMGYGFPQKDAFSAAHWFHDATDHGSGPAAHNLAVLHYHGQGIVKNEDRAIQLWKLGAARGVLHSMVAIAIYCLKNWQTEQARSWLATAYDMDPHEVQDDFPLTPEEQEGMDQTMHQIDMWRSKYTLRDINRWEHSVGLGTTRISSSNSSINQASSANLRPRIVRMLRRLDHEKEKISKVEEYLQSIKPKPVIIHFPKGEDHDLRSNSRSSSGGEYATTPTTERHERGKSCDTDISRSDKEGSIGSYAGGDSGIES